MTPAGVRPASRARSTVASVCPARRRTPPSLATSGNRCPGRTRSPGLVAGSTIARTVRARSSALMPVRHDSWSTGTVNGVRCGAVFVLDHRAAAASRSATSGMIGMQSSPRPCVIMNSIVSGVTCSAAAMKSPSFSRSSSSTTMTTRPSARAWRASSILEKAFIVGLPRDRPDTSPSIVAGGARSGQSPRPVRPRPDRRREFAWATTISAEAVHQASARPSPHWEADSQSASALGPAPDVRVAFLGLLGQASHDDRLEVRRHVGPVFRQGRRTGSRAWAIITAIADSPLERGRPGQRVVGDPPECVQVGSAVDRPARRSPARAT